MHVRIERGRTRRWIAVALLAAAAGVATAQAPGSPDRDAVAAQIEAGVEQMIAELELSAEQEAEVRAILSDNADERAALMREVAEIRAGGGSRRDRLGRMRALRDDFEALAAETRGELAEVLDEGQMAQMTAMMEARRAEVRARVRDRQPR